MYCGRRAQRGRGAAPLSARQTPGEPIWVVTPNAADLDALHQNSAVAHLGIQIVDVGADYLSGRMPVDARTMQPFGLLHGGAAVLLLETLASAAANHCVDPSTHMCVGVEVNCNHIRGVRDDHVVGKAQALHIGRATMVWSLEARDAQGRLVTAGRLTAAVVPAAP